MSCEPASSTDDQDQRVVVSDENPLAALIDQLQRNWDQGDNAANDDLVVRIREHIRRQRSNDDLGRDDLTPALRFAGREDDGGRVDDGGRMDDMAAVRWIPENTQAVADDVDYWSEHGVQVVSIRPRVDGSGAVIGVRRLTNHIVTAIQQRYPFPVHCWDASPPQ